MSSAKKMTVQQLRDALAERGLETAGLKADLVERYEKALQDNVPVSTTAAPAPSSTAPAPAPVPSPATPQSSIATAPSQPARSALASAAVSVPTISTSASTTATESDASKQSEMADLMAAKKRRAEKFGVELVQTDEDKKRLRGERFGHGQTKLATKTLNPASKTSDKKTPNQQNSKRTNPFKPTAAAPQPLSAEEQEKLAKRAARFGAAETQPNARR